MANSFAKTRKCRTHAGQTSRAKGSSERGLHAVESRYGQSFIRRDLNASVERCGLTDPPEKLMCLADLPGSREVITAAATAEVPDDKPAICGTVTLHCLDEEEPLRLSMPMLDALLLL